MRKFLFTFLLISAQSALAAPVHSTQKYPDPPNACYEGCLPWQQELLTDFESKGQSLNLEPEVSSGECHHLGASYAPETTHYAVVLIDRKEKTNEPRFATFFSFFAQTNPYSTWSLTKARKEMTEPWEPWGRLIIGEKTSRVEVPYEDGTIANRYWLRQNPETKTLYYITYFGGSYQKAFCRLEKNSN